jgi:subtilase family serine protease
LFSEELDKTVPCLHDFVFHNDIKFKEFTVTSGINSCFSAISGAGEDTFWLGSICTSNKDLSFNAYGLNYYFECYNYVESILYVDYQVFYYLFQFTKHLSGKKTDIIFISSIIDNVFYIANSDKSIYIKCYLSGKELKYKSASLDQIKQIYKIDKINSFKQIAKKIAIEEYNSLFKNFSRAFGEIVFAINYEYFDCIYDDNIKIWFMKSLPDE